jgi:hypothetical protein
MNPVSKFRQATVLILVTAAAVAAVPVAASAAASSPKNTSSARLVTPNDTVTCYFESDEPEQIVNGGTTYGHGQINSCTETPASCKLVVELFKQTPAGSGSWLPVAESNPGWSTNCSIGLTASYKCKGIIEKSDFYTQTTITFITVEGATGTNSVASPVANFWCD